MSEDEIIKKIENYENWKVVYNPGGLYQFIPLPKDYKQAIQGLLDLYQQEKEKNKELEEKLKIANQLYNDSCICIATECVEKDKIKAKIKELEEQEDWYIENKSLDDLYGRIDELKELLEEN
jgi:hypothetical protein